MSDFVKKPVSLEQDSIGSYIKKIREKHNIELEEVALNIDVNIKYLRAIENGNYKELPKGIYSKIFFKKYINFLGITHKNIVNDFVKEQNRNQNFESNIFFNKVVDWKNLLSLPKVIRNFLIFFAIVVCFVYLFLYFKNVFAPPFLEVNHPQENQILTDFFVNVSGQTEPESEVKINDQLILIDNDGDFSENIHLKSGVNAITIISKKKHSKENTITRQVLVETSK
ncbi:MAG TPA: helix-turn-helix domain-containing protein [bacterium]|nr:helix-turn-helix domain-containing protein [bacterium]